MGVRGRKHEKRLFELWLDYFFVFFFSRVNAPPHRLDAMGTKLYSSSIRFFWVVSKNTHVIYQVSNRAPRNNVPRFFWMCTRRSLTRNWSVQCAVAYCDIITRGPRRTQLPGEMQYCELTARVHKFESRVHQVRISWGLAEIHVGRNHGDPVSIHDVHIRPTDNRVVRLNFKSFLFVHFVCV